VDWTRLRSRRLRLCNEDRQREKDDVTALCDPWDASPLTPEITGTECQGRQPMAHWARAQGPTIFFLSEGPPTDCGEINLLKLTNYLITLAKINCTEKPGKYFLARGPVRLGGAQGPSAGKDATAECI